MNINKLQLTKETKESVFTKFLTSLSSRDLQIKVFLDSDYLTAFNPKNVPINDVNSFISRSIDSVQLSPPGLTRAGLDLGFLTELPYTVSMEGENAEVIARYLNDLVDGANIKTIDELTSIVNQKIAIRLDELSIERELLLARAKEDRLSQIARINEEDDQKIREINDQIDRVRFKAKENRLNEIVVLTEAAQLARSLGIIENNLGQISESEINVNLSVAINEDEDLPEWYLYGEKALVERIELLESRTSDDPFIPELVTLTNQLHAIQNNNLLETLKERQDDSPFIARINEIDIEKFKLESIIID